MMQMNGSIRMYRAFLQEDDWSITEHLANSSTNYYDYAKNMVEYAVENEVWSPCCL